MTKTPMPHFFQSEAWALFQKALGKKVVSRSGKGWHYNAVFEHGDGRVGGMFTRLYCPYGPHANNNDALKVALFDLEERAKEMNVDYVRIEPLITTEVIKESGFEKSDRNFQPDLTLIIDLDRPFAEILGDMSKTNRYLYRHAQRDGVSFNISYSPNDIEDFWLMMLEMKQRTHTIIRPKSYYRSLIETLGPEKQAGVAYGYHNKEVVVGLIFADDIVSKTRFYMYAGSNEKARKVSANASLLAFVIEDAHKKGLKLFDLMGVSPKDEPSHRWAGFSKFKRSFGGYEVPFNGTYEKPIRQFRYKIMTNLRKLSKK